MTPEDMFQLIEVERQAGRERVPRFGRARLSLYQLRLRNEDAARRRRDDMDRERIRLSGAVFLRNRTSGVIHVVVRLTPFATATPCGLRLGVETLSTEPFASLKDAYAEAGGRPCLTCWPRPDVVTEWSGERR